MSVFLAPTFGDGYQGFTEGGLPLTGGLIYTYLAGTSTPAATYTTSIGNVQNSNPVTLAADGRTPAEIWLTGGVAYKFVLRYSDGSLVPNGTYDNLSGINDSTAQSASEWNALGSPTYNSGTQFTLVGNLTATLPINIRLKSTNTGGTVYSSVTSTSYSAGTNTTTVNVVNDSGALDSGMSAASYSFLRSDHPSTPPFLGGQYAIADPVDATKRVTFGAEPVPTATTVNVTLPNSNQPLWNVGLTVTLGSNAATITLKTEDGSTPTATNACLISFRSATLATGTRLTRQVAASISTVISSGSTGGTVSTQASRIWIAAIDNAGTVELAWFNALNGTNIAPINEGGVITTIAEGGAGAADSAGIWYSTAARTAVPVTVIGYFESTQTTAGTWAQAIASIIVNPRYRPGDTVQFVQVSTQAVFTSSSATYVDVTNVTTGAMTLTSAANPCLVSTDGVWSGQGNTGNYIRLVRGSTAIDIGAAAGSRTQATAGGNPASANSYVFNFAVVDFLDMPNTTAPTYKLQAMTPTGTISIGASGDDTDNTSHGRFQTNIKVKEIMA